jgi:uridine kinase
MAIPTPSSGHPSFERIVEQILARDRAVRLVAIDGPGGSGKTTFAAKLSAAAGGATVVHTDDFASASNPINWWPRLLEQVIIPLTGGRQAQFQRYDWDTDEMAEWHTVEPAPIVIIEGVSAGRKEWAEHLSFVIWIDTPPQVRLQRGLERGGANTVEQWREWMAAEDEHYARDPSKQRADLIVSGTSDATSSRCIQID